MSSSDTDESLELMMKKAETGKVLEDLIREIVRDELRKDKNRTKQVETSCTTQEAPWDGACFYKKVTLEEILGEDHEDVEEDRVYDWVELEDKNEEDES